MQYKNAFDQLRASKEAVYFNKKNNELIENLQKNKFLQDERNNMAKTIGSQDETTLQALQDLGYTSETVSLLHLIPLLYVAWSEGRVTKRERTLLLSLARTSQIKENTKAYQKLIDWIKHKPTSHFFNQSLGLLRNVVDSQPIPTREATKFGLVSNCVRLAKVSGGFWRLGSVSSTEFEAIEKVNRELENDQLYKA